MGWNAYLSTLSHNAALDTTALLGVLDQASSLLDGWVPDQVVDGLAGLSAALGGGKCASRPLPSPPPSPGFLCFLPCDHGNDKGCLALHVCMPFCRKHSLKGTYLVEGLPVHFM